MEEEEEEDYTLIFFSLSWNREPNQCEMTGEMQRTNNNSEIQISTRLPLQFTCSL
jgi:hypothetical protein